MPFDAGSVNAFARPCYPNSNTILEQPQARRKAGRMPSLVLRASRHGDRE